MSSKIAKSMFAFAGFVTIITLSLWLFLRHNNLPSPPLKQSSINEAPLPAFYYRTIGHLKAQNDFTPPEKNLPFYTIELKVVRSETEAYAALEELKKKGLDAFYSPYNKDGMVLFRIRYGFTDTKEKARELALKLKSDHDISGKIISL